MDLSLLGDSNKRLREYRVKIGVEEAQPIGALFFVSSGSSLFTQGLVLESFSNSTSNTSKSIVLIVLWFTSLLYSLAHGNRVIVRSVSVVLGLGTLVDTPYLGGSVVAFLGESDNPLGS